MNWENTVVHASGCTTNLGVIGATCNCGAEHQAEVSFKAGQKEVTDWIEKNNRAPWLFSKYDGSESHPSHVEVDWPTWERQYADWEID